MKEKKKEIEERVFEFQKTLLLKSIDIRSDVIKRFDEQIFRVKEWCVLIWIGFLGWSFQKEILYMFIIAMGIPCLFWIISGMIKRLQRGYVITSNFLKKRLSNVETLKEMFQKKSLLEIPTYDMNGHYTIRLDKNHKDWYASKTSFSYSFWTKDLRYFYLSLIVINLIIVATVTIAAK